jgi:hypothetical protein
MGTDIARAALAAGDAIKKAEVMRTMCWSLSSA